MSRLTINLTLTGRKIVVAMMLMVIAYALIFVVAVRANCAYTGHQLERDTRYAAFVGCLVKGRDGWIPVANLREAQ